MTAELLQQERVTWLLSGQLADDQPVRHIRVDALPFLIGRQADASLSIPSATVSRKHAELTLCDGLLYLRDLGSTNGTFVNGTRVNQTCPINHGDLLQFGQVVFRMTQQSLETIHQTIQHDSCDRALALIQFDQLLTGKAVTPHFQSIVTIGDRQVVGYEVLGRSRLVGLKDPDSMFAAARVLNLEGELSRILREEGIRKGKVLPAERTLFVNTHPVEINDLDLLIFSLRELRMVEPRRSLVLEVHEAAVARSGQMMDLRAALTDMSIGLAYDDFGAGQARLVELVEVPPDYLKFDMKLVQNLETASAEHHTMLETLVQMVLELGITPLAEGIETEADHEICRQMGFTHAQGFLYARPELPVTLVHDSSDGFV
jgi:EAL domain-containing protein (putative c-di-GMP-specific phosphodiesterase class I)